MTMIIIDYYLGAIESRVRAADARENAERFAERMLNAGQITREQHDRAVDAIERMSELLAGR